MTPVLKNTLVDSTSSEQRWIRWFDHLPLLLLAGYLVFCHGCHGDEDNELCVFGREAKGQQVNCESAGTQRSEEPSRARSGAE
jgi:hypothetical protein